MTIGETTVITYMDTEKTSNEHIMTSECYDTICESDLIGYMGTPETSYQHIKTSEPYKTIGDTDIFVYIGVITEKLFEAICDTACISYVDALETSNAASRHRSQTAPSVTQRRHRMTSLTTSCFGRVEGSMWWFSNHHIERGCETSILLSSDIRDTPPLVWWLKVHRP